MFSLETVYRQVYKKMFGERAQIREWTAGSSSEDAGGWHCSWCFDVDGIINKLISALNGDFPRWGDYPEKQNPTYIKRLIANGVWFDDRSRLKRYDVISGPTGLLTNPHRYLNLIHNIYNRPTTELNTTEAKQLSNKNITV